METKQTAIDYIVSVVNSCIATDYIPNEIVKQAKQMEKEQIMNAWDKGDYCIDLPDGSWKQKYESGEQYYNETYGKENSN